MNDVFKALATSLGSLAPTLATMLGGPLAGAAVTALEGAFGLEKGAGADAITQVVQTGGMTPEIIASVRAADQRHAEIMGQQGIDLAKLNADHVASLATIEAGDRDSARKMQAESRSPVPAVLALLVTLGFFGILVGMMWGVLKVADNQALLIMLGALGASWGAIVNFYFGSSKGSDDKTALLARKA